MWCLCWPGEQAGVRPSALFLSRMRQTFPISVCSAPSTSASLYPRTGSGRISFCPSNGGSLYDRVVDEHFSELNHYGPPTLGTVSRTNDFFCINEETRLKYAIDERHVARIAPPGTKHFRGLRFTEKDWDRLRDGGDAVWLLLPDPGQLGVGEGDDAGLTRYLKRGVRAGVHKAYKCSIRDPWYRPPMVPAPDLFFTYMSHRYPRLIRNSARCSFVNSMHGVRLRHGVPGETRTALPLLALNAVTMLGAEIHGRSYGGGVLKMEPREAGRMPVRKTGRSGRGLETASAGSTATTKSARARALDGSCEAGRRGAPTRCMRPFA